MKENSYWQKHWESNSGFTSKNPHVKVGRTTFGIPILPENWELTLRFLKQKLRLSKEKNILDLCCGNGLISIEFAKYVQNVYSIDYSKVLIKELEAHKIFNIHSKCADVNLLNFKRDNFDNIIIYFAIQHFSKKETIQLLKKAKSWLKKGGQIYIGDIPDEEKIWQFFNQKKYRSAYFTALENSKPVIGNWFSKHFFLYLGEYLDFKNVEIIRQKKYMINQHYRFDILITK